ncbi:hypothetical protein MBLNU230_g7943t1 [Neophaeotheca triangularis]
MGTDCSRPSYTQTELLLPSDSLRLCIPSRTTPCWCKGPTHRTSRYTYIERDSSGRENYYDPFEYLDRAMLNHGFSSNGGRGGGGFGGLGAPPVAAWKDPSLWTTRDYERLGEVMGEYFARERGKSGGYGGGGWPVYGGALPVGMPMSGVGQGFDASAMWPLMALMGMGGGGGWDRGSRSGSRRGHRSSGYSELSEQIRRLEEVYRRDKEMSDAMLYGTEAERREKAWQQRLVKQLFDVWPQFMQMQQQQQQNGMGMGMGMPGIGTNPMGFGMSPMAAAALQAQAQAAMQQPQGGMGHPMGANTPMMDVDPRGFGGGGGGPGRRRMRRNRRALPDYDDFEEAPWGRNRGRRGRGGFGDDIDDDDDLDMLGGRDGGRRGPKGPGPAPGAGIGGFSKPAGSRNSDGGSGGGGGGGGGGAPVPNAGILFPNPEADRQSDRPAAAQPPAIPSQRPSPRAAAAAQPTPSARPSPIPPSPADRRPEPRSFSQQPQFSSLFPPGDHLADTGPDLPPQQAARQNHPWTGGWLPEGAIPVPQNMPPAGGTPVGAPMYPVYGVDAFGGEAGRFGGGGFVGESRPGGFGAAGVTGGGAGIGRTGTGERRVGFSGADTGLGRQVEEDLGKEGLKGAEAGVRAARADRQRGAYSD